MTWLSKNPAQLTLAIVAGLLLGGAFMVYSSISEFPSKVLANPPAPVPGKDLPKPDLKPMVGARESIASPATWQTDPKKHGLIFGPKAYVLHEGILVEPGGSTFNPPVPNKWLIEHGLDPTVPSVLNEDADGEGFSNIQEWKGMDGLAHQTIEGSRIGVPVLAADGKALPNDSTDPTDPKSHPGYHTRLEAANITNIPFRLKFMASDVTNGVVTVAVNTIDQGNKTVFIEVPGKIPGSEFSAQSYKEKLIKLPNGDEKDVSELTVVNKATKGVLVLPKGVVVDSPESYATLRYSWVAPGGRPTPDMNKKKGDTFSLPPENDKHYKVVEIKTLTSDAQNRVLTGEVTIALPTGQNHVLKFPAPK